MPACAFPTAMLLRTIAGPPPTTMPDDWCERITTLRSMTLTSVGSRAPYTMIPGPLVSTTTLSRIHAVEPSFTCMP
jgi:hypothetical protein